LYNIVNWLEVRFGDILDKTTMRLGLGSIESKVLSNFSAEGKSIFTIAELSEKIHSKTKARKMASSLAKKKWLERLSKGTYLILELGAGSEPKWVEDAYYIASKLANPYYIGYYSMLNHYGWTEQVPSTVTLITTKVLRSKNILGTKYDFITLSKKKFFGFNETNIRGHKIMISGPEKTIVDALDHPEYCGGINEVAKAFYNAKIDWNKVIAYAIRMKNGAIFKRMGYLAEKTEAPIPNDIIKIMKRHITKGYSPLYPGIKSKTTTYNSTWNIAINTNISKEGAHE